MACSSGAHRTDGDAYNARVNNLYILFAALVGAGLAMQAAINTQLRAATGSALWASILSATLTVILLGGSQLVAREALVIPSPSQYPWWIWIGGIMGAFYVFAIAAFTRYLGVALMFGSIIAGQLLTGLLIDHYGLFHSPVQRLSPARAAGALLLVAGLALIRWK
jgi:bacterial/archaeal transporter family-2 protein